MQFREKPVAVVLAHFSFLIHVGEPESLALAAVVVSAGDMTTSAGVRVTWDLLGHCGLGALAGLGFRHDKAPQPRLGC